MVLLLDYLIRRPYQHDYNINFVGIDWETIASLLVDVLTNSGEFVVQQTEPVYNEDKYVEFKTETGYICLGRYSLVSDSHHGFLMGCSFNANDLYPQGAYFSLINKAAKDPKEKIVFQPHEDEWDAELVNQDINIALAIFKELYDNGEISEATLSKWFRKYT